MRRATSTSTVATPLCSGASSSFARVSARRTSGSASSRRIRRSSSTTGHSSTGCSPDHSRGGTSMPAPLDEYPLHQAPQSLSYVGSSDRNFYDRCYFNAHDRDGGTFLVTGRGYYPTLGV